MAAQSESAPARSYNAQSLKICLCVGNKISHENQIYSNTLWTLWSPKIKILFDSYDILILQNLDSVAHFVLYLKIFMSTTCQIGTCSDVGAAAHPVFSFYQYEFVKNSSIS